MAFRRKKNQNLTSWNTLLIKSLPLALKCSLWPYPYFTLSNLSNKTKIAQFEVHIRKLWPREVERVKQGVQDKAQTIDWFAQAVDWLLGCHFWGPFVEIAHFRAILMGAYKENILGL